MSKLGVGESINSWCDVGEWGGVHFPIIEGGLMGVHIGDLSYRLIVNSSCDIKSEEINFEGEELT